MEEKHERWACAYVEAVLGFWEWIEIKKEDLKFTTEVRFQSCKVGFRFLRTVLRSKAIWSTKNLVKRFGLPFSQDSYESIFEDLDRSVNAWLAMLDHVKPEFVEACVIALENSRLSKSVMSSDLLVELFDSLLENLTDLLTWNVSLNAPLKEQIKALEVKLQFLRNFITFTTKKNMQSQIVVYAMEYIEAVANNIACLSYLSWIDDIDEETRSMASLKLADQLEKLKPNELNMREIYSAFLKALESSEPCSTIMQELVKSFIISLLHDLKELQSLEPSLTVSVSNSIQILSLAEFLLTDFLGQPEGRIRNKEFHNLWMIIETMTSEVGAFVYSFYVRETEDEMAREMELSLPEFLEYIKPIMKAMKVNYKYRKSSHFDFPRIDQLGFMDSLLGKLSELLIYKLESIAFIMHEIEILQTDLKFLISFLRELADSYKEHEELQNLKIRVSDAAYEAEYLIDSLLVGDIRILVNLFCLLDVFLEISIIKEEVTNDKKFRLGTRIAASPSDHGEVVEFKGEAQRIIDCLTCGSAHLQVICIVGNSGIGKSTLAKRLYNDPLVTDHFHIRAWLCASQVDWRNLLLDALSHVIELTDQIYKMGCDGLFDTLCKCLKGRRYLIVIDDIRENEISDISFFPNDINGSRILLTSTISNVTLEDKDSITFHSLNLLSEDESWLILQKKLFDDDGCPSSLTKMGKRIAKNCKGLPLSLVVMAGLLGRTEKKQDWWEQVAEESSSSPVTSNSQKDFMNICELSYKHLPDQLKPCFLYFGVFPKGNDVGVKNLMWLWIAEGFVRSSKHRSLEEVAENYITDLVDRNLINVGKRRSNGGIKTCHLHDLLHEFCVEKAKEVKFFHPWNDEYLIDSSDGLCIFAARFQLTSLRQSGSYLRYSSDDSSSEMASPVPITCKPRRLCIFAARSQFTSLRLSGSYVRSLLFFSSNERCQIQYNDISFVSRMFKLLSVLDLGCINVGDFFPSEISLLVRLRYLAIQGCISFIPSSISCLSNLGTFIVKGLKGEVVLPNSIWGLVRLRHLHINDQAAFTLDNYQLEVSSEIQNLETFSTPSLTYGEDSKNMLRRLSRLRKLRCIFFESWNSAESCNRFPILDFLSQLESLKVFYHGSPKYPCDFNFPLTLKKLTLSKFHLPWREISTIARLPNLEVLKLLCQAFEGTQWNVKEDEFLKLKFLKLENLNIVIWNVNGDHFPCLQELVLERCKLLKEIPSSFGNILSLQTIGVHWCNQSAANSAKQIQEKRQELKVFIHPPH